MKAKKREIYDRSGITGDTVDCGLLKRLKKEKKKKKQINRYMSGKIVQVISFTHKNIFYFFSFPCSTLDISLSPA